MRTPSLRILLIFAMLVAVPGASSGTQKGSANRVGGDRHQAASGQQTATPSPSENAPQAKTADVDTLEHILAAVYDVISGPPGPRDWNRFRSLFYPGARLIPTRGEQGNVTAKMLTADEYVHGAQGYFEQEGFYEAPVANRVEQWDHIAHVWSTYESRHAKSEKPFARGINSFQFFNDGSRWWVVTIYWEGEGAGHPLPEKYLK
jgi:hypothetical protein